MRQSFGKRTSGQAGVGETCVTMREGQRRGRQPWHVQGLLGLTCMRCVMFRERGEGGREGEEGERGGRDKRKIIMIKRKKDNDNECKSQKKKETGGKHPKVCSCVLKRPCQIANIIN